jgi:hypothetical protein
LSWHATWPLEYFQWPAGHDGTLLLLAVVQVIVELALAPGTAVHAVTDAGVPPPTPPSHRHSRTSDPRESLHDEFTDESPAGATA